MDVPGLLAEYSLGEYPAGIGGCQNCTPYACCEHDVMIFDEKSEPDTMVQYMGDSAVIHHCSLGETHSDILVQLDGLRIIQDERWELHMMLSRIREKKSHIYRDAMRNCLVDALFCVTKSRRGAESKDPFAPYWTKCAAFYLADAIVLYNEIRPSPAHFLHSARSLGGRVGAMFADANECIGIERATPVLLERMAKSTAGFSDTVEGNGRSKIIAAKSEYMIAHSLHADCYFYLGHANRRNLMAIKGDLARRPDLIHILRVAMDVEGDAGARERHNHMIYEAASSILAR